MSVNIYTIHWVFWVVLIYFDFSGNDCDGLLYLWKKNILYQVIQSKSPCFCFTLFVWFLFEPDFFVWLPLEGENQWGSLLKLGTFLWRTRWEQKKHGWGQVKGHQKLPWASLFSGDFWRCKWGFTEKWHVYCWSTYLPNVTSWDTRVI